MVRRLSRETKKSRDAKSRRREEESAENRNERLSTLREAVKRSRAGESVAAREARLRDDRQRMADHRANESATDREERLRDKRQRTADHRATESAADREDRLHDDRQRKYDQRATESDSDPAATQMGHSAMGRMSIPCTHCGALRWKAESPNICCAGGKVRLPERSVPQLLTEFYNGRHPLSAKFLSKIRSYNSAFHMTSFGANLRRQRGWCPSFIISGQVHHSRGPLLADSSEEPRGWQVYFSDQDLVNRLRLDRDLNMELVQLLQERYLP